MNSNKQNKKVIYFLSGFLFLAQIVSAHTINYSLENAPVHEVAWFYFTLGFSHIIPQGIEHVLLDDRKINWIEDKWHFKLIIDQPIIFFS